MLMQTSLIYNVKFVCVCMCMCMFACVYMHECVDI